MDFRSASVTLASATVHLRPERGDVFPEPEPAQEVADVPSVTTANAAAPSARRPRRRG